MTVEEMRAERNAHARLCADLLHRGHLHEAKRHAADSERWAEKIRAAVAS